MGNYFGDGNTGKFFLNRPFSKVGIASGSGPHRYKERSHAGHFAFARHNMSYFLNEQTLPSHPFLALGLELSYNLNNWIYQLMFLILENWVDKMAYMSLNKGPAGHFFKLPTPSSAFSIQIVHIHCVFLRFVNYQKSWTEMEFN